LSLDAPAAIIDGRPIHRVSDDTIWGDAAALRNACHDAIRHALDQRRIEALVTRSANGVYPAWVKVEAWLPQAAGAGISADPRLRTTLDLHFAVKPYRECPVTTSAVARIGRRAIAVAERPNFTADDAVDWVLYALGSGGKPRAARFSDFLANVALALIPFTRTRYANRVLRPFRSLFPVTLARLLVLAGLALIALGIYQVDPDFGPPPIAIGEFALGALALAAAFAVARQRRTVVSVIDRPTIPPRYLLRLDSWHAVIPELGPALDEVKQRFLGKLEAFAPSGVATETERYGFRSPNGYDERDRLVITKGQGVAHLHVYRFGADVFVGWDSYVNWAQWAETRPVSARVAAGRVTEYRGLEPGLYVPNEYDLIDLNSLIEIVHRCVSDVLKAMMEEHKIDQEVDFNIIRGDRDNALDRDRYDRRLKQRADGDASPRRRWRVS
jgi:hypothetical protein